MSADETRFDVTVIGSGPGGYVAAIRAAQLGMKTAVVEMAPVLGGTCLHWGCIPTKALLQAAEVLDTTKHAGKFGVRVPPGELDLPAVHQYKNKVVTSNTKGIEYLFKKHGITVVQGRGRLRGRGRVEVTPKDGAPKTIESKHVVLATGSAVRGLPGIEFDGQRVINSDHALNLERIPKSLIVMGAGAVGVEFALIYASFGSKVTIVELLPRLLPIEDASLGAELEKAFVRRGIAVHTATRVETVDRDDRGVRVHATKGDAKVNLEAEMLLVAVGRKPMIDDIGLQGSKIRVDKGFVEVDSLMRTGEEGVYAIGDIVKTQALAHVASHEGIVAVEHAAGRPTQPVNYDKVPSCTYCSPEVASIGLSEEEAKRRGLEVRVGVFPMTALAKAKILDDTRGFVRVVAEKKYDEVVGVHIIGAHATELISEAVAALALEATAESLFRAVHAHPTLAEALGEAAAGVHGESIHI